MLDLDWELYHFQSIRTLTAAILQESHLKMSDLEDFRGTLSV